MERNLFFLLPDIDNIIIAFFFFLLVTDNIFYY